MVIVWSHLTLNEWTNNVRRRPGSRKDRTTSSSTLRLSDCESHESESFTDDNSEYDSELIHSEISDHDEYDN